MSALSSYVFKTVFICNENGCFQDKKFMGTQKKKILIVDEAGFSRICSAILEKEGYGTNSITDVHQLNTIINYDDFGLVITSYPYGAFLLEKLRKIGIPTIILSDYMNRELLMTLEHFDKSLSHCMIKPLDYNKFRTLINQTMARDREKVVEQ